MKATALLVISACILMLPACDEDDDCNAGQGGNLTLVVHLEHHGAPIYSQGNYRDTVMVKFNTQEFPGASPSLYDIVMVGDSGESHVHIPGLNCGEYYLFATGFDTTISQRVFGGRPISTAESAGELGVDVSVTE